MPFEHRIYEGVYFTLERTSLYIRMKITLHRIKSTVILEITTLHTMNNSLHWNGSINKKEKGNTFYMLPFFSSLLHAITFY